MHTVRRRVVIFATIGIVLIAAGFGLPVLARIWICRGLQVRVQVPQLRPAYLGPGPVLRITFRNGSSRPVIVSRMATHMEYQLIATDLAGRVVDWQDRRWAGSVASPVLPPQAWLVDDYEFRHAHGYLPPGEYFMKVKREVCFHGWPHVVSVESPRIRVKVAPDLTLTQIR